MLGGSGWFCVVVIKRSKGFKCGKCFVFVS